MFISLAEGVRTSHFVRNLAPTFKRSPRDLLAEGVGKTLHFVPLPPRINPRSRPCSLRSCTSYTLVFHCSRFIPTIHNGKSVDIQDISIFPMAEGVGIEPTDGINRHGLASRCITALPTLRARRLYHLLYTAFASEKHLTFLTPAPYKASEADLKVAPDVHISSTKRIDEFLVRVTICFGTSNE
jgi:hypothetical protein